MMEIKTFRIEGEALFNESRFPVRQKFVKFVRALNEAQAKEVVYSHFGSKNKIKRCNIVFKEIREVPLESVKDKRIKDLAKLDKVIT
ncbi:MAG: 50S ribosomal protein L18Ae [Metallosphaera yellowstonensis]|jgi:LSU ribosomal protein LX|uniref:Large ribosomal subunit protein eL20 n=1 Tax=Metallosphaera yellowstonensis MK1 TaxID=671065 RepID=H2C842_9CREN|nr:50S ribosomal protein L18Ae [Metallosphaera yellowstonensis]EHP68318.1 ribosomal protein L20A (L18A) [Metallosphaera yellowstonensis MK1]